MYVIIGHFAYASKPIVVPEPVTSRTFEETSTDATNIDIMQISIGAAELLYGFPLPSLHCQDGKIITSCDPRGM
jgi:hypothetical protein